MIYPTIEDYLVAVKYANLNFKELKNLRLVLDSSGAPIIKKGDCSVVIKMKDDIIGKSYALKCFLKDQKGRDETYHIIEEELNKLNSPYFVQIRYFDEELLVKYSDTEKMYPVLLMDWVEGLTLDQYILDNIEDRYLLQMLAYRFNEFTRWIIDKPLAHGNLKPDHILVREDCHIVLIDFDSMFLPPMKEKKAIELGSPNFQHPQKTEDDFNERMDDFSLISILLSLNLISLNPNLYTKINNDDGLILHATDYNSPLSSTVLKDNFPSVSPLINRLLYLFTVVMREKILSKDLIPFVDIKEDEYSLISTNYKKEELEDAWVDEYGAKYSRNKKKLLSGPSKKDIPIYFIKDGTRLIGDNAFRSFQDESTQTFKPRQIIVIPKSIIRVGKNPFSSFIGTLVCESHFFKVVDNNLFSADLKELFSFCSSELHYNIPDTVRLIREGAFSNSKIYSVGIPNSVISICSSAFSGSKLKSVNIPNSVVSIEDHAFYFCSSLTSIKIPESVTNIGWGVFYGCHEISELSIENSNPIYDSRDDCNAIIRTCDNTLLFGCKNTIIPKTVKTIGDSSFDGCKGLDTIVIPESVSTIGWDAFASSSIKSLIIPKSVNIIGKRAFFGSAIRSIDIQSDLETIEEDLFQQSLLESIIIPRTVKRIEAGAFTFSQLKHIVIPDSVSSIGEAAFAFCDLLEDIYLPRSLKSQDGDLFFRCYRIKHIFIPNGTKDYFVKLFKDDQIIHPDDKKDWNYVDAPPKPFPELFIELAEL